jgi:DNA-binding transcriptional LysR family regulator
MVDERPSRDTLRRGRSAAVALEHLRFAVSAAEHGSFRRAAEALLLRQSTLSRRIRELEELIGLTIFERSSGGVRATPGGRDLLRMARSILEQMDALMTTAYIAGRGEAGRLSIGFYTSLSSGSLRTTLSDFRRRFPQVQLGMVERSRTHLVTTLRNGAVDIAIVTGESPLLDCNAMSLWSERIYVALPEGHRLATGDTIYWTDLRSETVLFNQRDPGRDLEDLLITKLAIPGVRPKIERHDVSCGITNNLITMGFGVGLVAESDIGASFSGLVYRELRDGAGPSRFGYSAHWRKDNDNPVLTSFLELLSERYPSPREG